MAEQHCYFLELPKEMRLLIYAELLSPKLVVLRSYDSPSIIGKPEADVATSRFFRSLEPHCRGSTHPEILRTCRIICEEGQPMLYMPNTLRLNLSFGSGDTDWNDGLQFDVRKLGHIRQLQELTVDLVTTPKTAEEDVAHSVFLAGCFSAVLSLDRLAINVPLFQAQEEGSIDSQTHSQMLSAWSNVGSPKVVAVYCADVEQMPLQNCSWQKITGAEWTQCEGGQSDGDAVRPNMLLEALKRSFPEA
ncbi:hypothetical protein LTR36_000115 [Oleoguttula mirabilis]|uniref:Uncharacterized protein n=1 Tax=Oleoguttula mirabilis TaxID=1507867 RepID=A0AAV9JZK1_9PEZI|nr:hypothetical protein LTR36_000115 [Oleoguttula mirabilis]